MPILLDDPLATTCIFGFWYSYSTIGLGLLTQTEGGFIGSSRFNTTRERFDLLFLTPCNVQYPFQILMAIYASLGHGRSPASRFEVQSCRLFVPGRTLRQPISTFEDSEGQEPQEHQEQFSVTSTGRTPQRKENIGDAMGAPVK
jgi:hypothetical protein